jgi:hypothetical protein
MRNIIITTLATTVMAFSFNANARFSVELEYAVMKYCVDKPENASICTCAIVRSNNNGYPRDNYFYNNELEFVNELEKNVQLCK